MEPLPKCGNIVVNLEEQVALYFLWEADTRLPIISSQCRNAISS